MREALRSGPRVLVCGDRHWWKVAPIRRELEKLPRGTVVIHGAARGADSLAGRVAKELGMEVLSYPANWGRYGRAAGPIRNQQMLEDGRPQRVLAFHHDLSKSKGTRHMVQIARQAGVPVKVIEE